MTMNLEASSETMLLSPWRVRAKMCWATWEEGCLSCRGAQIKRHSKRQIAPNRKALINILLIHRQAEGEKVFIDSQAGGRREGHLLVMSSGLEHRIRFIFCCFISGMAVSGKLVFLVIF